MEGLGSWVRKGMSIVAGLVLFGTGLTMYLGYDFNSLVMAIIILLVGGYLILESQIKIVGVWRQLSSLHWRTYFHWMSAVLGFTLVVIGLLALPGVAALLKISTAKGVVTAVTSIGGFWALAEAFIR